MKKKKQRGKSSFDAWASILCDHVLTEVAQLFSLADQALYQANKNGRIGRDNAGDDLRSVREMGFYVKNVMPSGHGGRMSWNFSSLPML